MQVKIAKVDKIWSAFGQGGQNAGVCVLVAALTHKCMLNKHK